MRLSPDEFQMLVTQALDEVPDQFRPYLDALAVDIEPEPNRTTLRSVEMEDDPHGLLGFYVGVPLTQRSVEHSGELSERIVIYQNNIQRICRNRREVIDQVRTTVLHEIGHHFGLDEDELEELGYG